MRPYKRVVLHRRIVVNLDTGRSFDGVLWAEEGDLIVLRDANLHDPGQEPVPLDGEIVISRARVEFVQAVA